MTEDKINAVVTWAIRQGYTPHQVMAYYSELIAEFENAV